MSAKLAEVLFHACKSSQSRIAKIPPKVFGSGFMVVIQEKEWEKKVEADHWEAVKAAAAIKKAERVAQFLKGRVFRSMWDLISAATQEAEVDEDNLRLDMANDKAISDYSRYPFHSVEDQGYFRDIGSIHWEVMNS